MIMWPEIIPKARKILRTKEVHLGIEEVGLDPPHVEFLKSEKPVHL